MSFTSSWAFALRFLVGAVSAASLATGTITEFPIPTAYANPFGIAPSPDGNLWFTERDGNKLGRITPAGAMTEFPLPVANSSPLGIVTGPDGNVWFAEYNAMIGRITPSGTITEFPAPFGTRLWDITPGPDGNLWFTEWSGGKIGRITTEGVITEFPLPLNSSPLGIAAGPDGNLWFTELNHDQVGRITPAGVITLFPTPSADSDPYEITPGPDGNLWFTDHPPYAASKIARITPGGTITEFPLPAGRYWSYGVAPGPDGNLWFTELHPGNTIGRLKASKAGTVYVLSLAAGFAPAVRTGKRGGSVKWVFLSPGTHTATDSSGMSLFDSGTQPLVSFYSFNFTGAGSYAYKDTLHPTLTGTIKIPLAVSPSRGTISTVFTITWASAPPRAGFVEDIQLKRPGAGAFVNWLTGQTATSATFTPDAGPGSYSFRARLRKNADNTQSGYSPTKSIKVN